MTRPFCVFRLATAVDAVTSVARRGLRTVVVAALLAIWGGIAVACPFCNPNLTFTERIDQAHVAYVVEWISGHEGLADRGETGQTQVRVLHVFKTAAPQQAVGDVLTLPQFSFGQPGARSLLFGQLREGEVLGWDGLVPCSNDLFAYLQLRPGPEVKAPARLPFFIPYLEHPDEDLAVDAYSEFGNAPYDAVKAVAVQLPRDKLVAWVAEPNASTGRIARIGFYGLALGLCGGETEAQALEQVIVRPPVPGEDFRLGIDGLMAGFLLLRGESGLEVLKTHALAPGMPASEGFALQQAVRFVWDFGGGGISREALRATLRPLVESPQFAELVIADLSRWEDFTLVDTLINKYGQAEFDNQPTQTAIARYYLSISTLDPTGRPESERAAIERAGRQLQQLRERDPELVAHAERFLRPKVATTPPPAPSPETPVLAVEGSAAAAVDAPPRLGNLALVAAGVFAVVVLLRRWRRSRTSGAA